MGLAMTIGRTIVFWLEAAAQARRSACTAAKQAPHGAETPPTRRRTPRSLARSAALMMLLVMSSAPSATARVLTEADLENISRIRAGFAEVVTDMSQALRRTDLPASETECVQSVLQELMQIAEELSSYEHLITIEQQIGDFGDDKAMKGLLRFAV